jgi:hypothetical protein
MASLLSASRIAVGTFRRACRVTLQGLGVSLPLPVEMLMTDRDRSQPPAHRHLARAPLEKRPPPSRAFAAGKEIVF